MKKSATPDINLLPFEDIEKTPFGKFLKWALSIGRYIIVVTELLVLLAFLSRFKLDRDLSDLSEEIARQKNIITSQQTFETKVRKLQAQLAAAKIILADTQDMNKALDIVAADLPAETQMEVLQVKGNTLVLQGSVVSESGMATLLNALQKDPKISNISLSKIEKSTENGTINFVLTAKIWL